MLLEKVNKLMKMRGKKLIRNLYINGVNYEELMNVKETISIYEKYSLEKKKKSEVAKFEVKP